MQVLNKNIIVDVGAQEEKQTEGGIYLPEQTKDVPNTGIVVDPGTVPNLKAGMKVWFKMWSDTQVAGHKTWRFIPWNDLLAVEGGEND